MAKRLSPTAMMQQGFGVSAGAPYELLENMFAPGSIYGLTDRAKYQGYYQDYETLNPFDVLQGSERFGVTAWDDLFNEQAQIADLDAFYRAMNVGSVLGSNLVRREHLYSDYGTMASEWGDYFIDYDEYGNPLSESTHGYGYTGLAEDLPELVRWLAELSGLIDGGHHGLNRSSGFLYDPTAIAFDDPTDFSGIDITSATQAELDKWARDTYGVSLKNLAAGGADLASGYRDWRHNPNLWFDPLNPTQLLTTDIPGIRAGEDEQLRLQNFAEAYANLIAEQEAQGQARSADYMASLAMTDPNIARSAFGASLGQTQGLYGDMLGQLLGFAPSAPTGYGFGMQYSMLEDEINQAMRQLRSQY